MIPSFVGTWHLVSFEVVDSDGSTHPYWDEHPIGQLMYTADGHMSAQVYDARRRALGVEVDDASAESIRPLYVGSVSYFGTYSVDTVAKCVTHTVQGAWLPDWIGRHLERAYRFVGDNRLELTTPEFAILWQRVSE